MYVCVQVLYVRAHKHKSFPFLDAFTNKYSLQFVFLTKSLVRVMLMDAVHT